MSEYNITPKVDPTQEFIEIANDFSNPLELVREAISNSIDAKAKNIHISFDVIKEFNERILIIKIRDDGNGMDNKTIQNFFDLGNSSRRTDPESIGEKGHGTKIFFNSSRIEVVTKKDKKQLKAIFDNPFKKLYNRDNIEINVIEEIISDDNTGTEIIIKGYNNNRSERFTQEILEDYILWFAKFGSFEKYFDNINNKDVKLFLKGLNVNEPEIINFGHFFPDESENVNELFRRYTIKAPDYYCKMYKKKGFLRKYPEIKYEALFNIEGNRIKQDYNKMLRRKGYQAPFGAYTVQERYGLWLCKDFIPIQRKNEWITKKGSEYTKFHAFFNCQAFNLTANRGSVENTPYEYLEDIKNEIENIYNEIIDSSDWQNIEWLEEEVDAYTTVEKEKSDYEWRLKKVKQSNIANFNNLILVQPERESGVFALVLQIMTIKPELFPFKILDYDTHSGIDIIVKSNDKTPIFQSKLFYVEFKYYLTENFNHSFQNLNCIICWDTNIKDGELVQDITKEERKLHIIAPSTSEDYTKYFLDNPKSAHKIEVFVLKDYLKQKFNIDFRPRTDKDTY